MQSIDRAGEEARLRFAYTYQDLDVRVYQQAQSFRVELSGAAGVGACSILELAFTRVSACRPETAVVDGRQLRELSVLALGILGTFHRSVRQRGGDAHLEGAPLAVREQITERGFADLLDGDTRGAGAASRELSAEFGDARSEPRHP